ncbi:MAG: HEAT repeat domain-containing protein, partial [Candidatus Aminicenantales bacterium]
KVVADKGKEAETAKMEVAKAVGLMESSSPLSDVLEELLQEESPEVSRYAMESVARLKRKEYIPALIDKLKNPVIREDAGSALEKFGSKIVGTLADYLADDEEDIEVRKEAASVLARLGSQEAAELLSWELAEEKEEVEREIIDALDRIRFESQDVEFSSGIIKTVIARKVKKYCQSFLNLHESKSRKKSKDQTESQTRVLSECLSEIFKLLELIYSREDIVRAFQNVRSGTKDSVAYAVELLDNILEKEIKEIILPLIEDMPYEERWRRCSSLLKNFPEL